MYNLWGSLGMDVVVHRQTDPEVHVMSTWIYCGQYKIRTPMFNTLW